MPPPSQPGLVVAVVSGKGGTGKSTVAVNLAETLAGHGRRVALFDADPCQSSCATMMNEEPAATLLAVASGAVALDRAYHTTSTGITLVVSWAATRPSGLPTSLFDALDGALGEAIASHDVVLIDAPAGIDDVVRWALDRADAGLLVVVGEPTSITGAYALAKTVWQTVPAYPFLTVVNAADTEVDATQTADRFADLTRQFLGQAPSPLGWLPYDAHVRAAVRDQVPAVRRSAPLQASFSGLMTALTPLFPVSA